MTLETRLDTILAQTGVRRVEFIDSPNVVSVVFDEEEVFDTLDDDSDESIHAHVQEYFGVDWSVSNHGYLPSGWYHAKFER